MAKRKRKRSFKKPKIKTRIGKDWVAVTNTWSYGKRLQGQKIYWEGKRPSGLKDDGTIGMGKNILELLNDTFGDRFKWIITDNDTNEITQKGDLTKIRTSQKVMTSMNSESINRGKEIKETIIQKTFSAIYPTKFTYSGSIKYKGGDFAELLKENVLADLTPQDKDALNKFIPDYISHEAPSTVSTLKAETQILTLRELANNIRREIAKKHPESWWQNFIKSNILLIQQGYINSITDLNVAIGGTKYPDFCLITHDEFIDILEIKRPDTKLVRHDKGRDNHFWDDEISKAIIQVEKYIENIIHYAAEIQVHIDEKHSIKQRVVRPRGIILAGDRSTFTPDEEKDFRLLSSSTKNISFLTYDELATRVENYIKQLEKFAPKESAVKKSKPKK